MQALFLNQHDQLRIDIRNHLLLGRVVPLILPIQRTAIPLQLRGYQSMFMCYVHQLCLLTSPLLGTATAIVRTCSGLYFRCAPGQRFVPRGGTRTCGTWRGGSGDFVRCIHYRHVSRTVCIFVAVKITNESVIVT